MVAPIIPYTQDPAQWINSRCNALVVPSLLAGVGNTADTNEDILFSTTIPYPFPNPDSPASNPLLHYNGSALRLSAWGVTANNGDTKTLRLYHGTTTFSQALTTSTANPWYAELVLVRISLTSQFAKFMVIHGTAILALSQSTSGSDSLATALVAKVTAQASAGNANDVVCNGALLEIIA